ncbi:MAG: 2-C-methyl-D-erythritol 2,4-cyclodiphosphate synthase [Planctomycetota bacterium]
MLAARMQAFARRTLKLCSALPRQPEADAIRRQLVRSATSVSANYRAAQRARSKKEFIAKLGIVEEEADESCHWLELVISSEFMKPELVQPLLLEANELTAIVVSSIRSARRTTRQTQLRPAASPLPPPPSPLRLGHGFDLHRLEVGHRLIVGGEQLDHDRGCDAHSDGDVVYHAVTDAVLGALGQDDIGQLFPDNDPKWKAADSRIFVEEAVRRMRDAGYAIGNLDVTVVLQRPKLSPHKAAMKANLAALLDTDLANVNLKGKTHEHVDALGENRAIACHVVVLLTPADE